MKRLFLVTAVCLAMVILFVCPVQVHAAETTGTCGENLTWVFDDETGTLTVSGTGEMYDYEWDNELMDYTDPWEYSISINIKQVVVEEGVTSIGSHAFTFPKMASITLPESLTRIGGFAFACASNLWQIELPENLTELGEGAFMECSSLRELTIPEGITVIPNNCFLRCPSLGDVHMHDGITEIGSWAFANCTRIGEAKLPAGLKIIGGDAFYGCASLTSVELPEGLEVIEGSAFGDCRSLRQINIPSTVTKIGSRAFRNCSSLAEILFPEGLTKIDEYAFDGCSSLTQVTLPDSLESLGRKTFMNCSSLEEVSIPGGLSALSGNTFGNCYKLKNIYFTGTAPRYISDEAFAGVTADVYYPEGDETWTSDKMKDYGGTLTWHGHVHDYGSWVETDPTCTEEGYTDYNCFCGSSYQADFIPALGHSYTDGICAHCGKEEPDVLFGDANGDGTVNNVDAMLILQYAVGLNGSSTFNLDACDVNGDGSVNNVDAMLVLQFAVGLVSGFPNAK